TYTSGTRGLQDTSGVMAEAKKQLQDLKRHDANATQRRNLDKAIRLLPKLEGNEKAQDEFVTLVLSLLDDSPADKTEGLSQIRTRPGSELFARLGTGAPQGTRGIGGWFSGIAGSVGQFLNLTQWYVMKDRSGTVGSVGVAPAVRALHKSCPDLRIHLVGHSLGGRVMASCAKALSEAPTLQVDSLMLLEAAFSHFGFSDDNGHGASGFFRDVVVKQVVKGPFLSTFSTEDTVVGNAYAIMSGLACDNTREIGDASDEFGGIGRNGPLKTTEVANFPFQKPGKAYAYKPGVINNLDGSGGFIKDHADVMNEAVTYAFASAVAQTR
ncbi:MAG: cutinase family protein, partial [Vicinamibacterales bacterium]